MRELRAVLAALTLLCAAAAVAAPVSAAQFRALQPGGLTPLPERVEVNVVFVGFEEGEVPWEAVRAQLADRGQPVVRSRLWYGVQESLGLDFTYAYRPHYTGQAWEDEFFAFLRAQARPAELTLFQDAYNGQLANALEVTGNHEIDAPTVEKRLVDRPPPGVDTRRPTVFFIDWHGRDDFVFHVYTKRGEPDPDTGYDFGEQRQSRRIVAWGGTPADDPQTGLGARGTHRVWFHDLSAGPESWGGSWNVDDADLDGDGVADYRIPPSWEYGAYRPAEALPADLGRVVRYVAVNLLFTSSPLFPPYHQPDRVPRRIDLDLNTVEGWPGLDASERFLTPGQLLGELSELPTGYRLTLDEQDVPYEGDLRRCYRFFVLNLRCDETRPFLPPFANLFLATARNLDRLLDGDPQFEAPAVNFAVDEPEPRGAIPLGFTDTNWTDGTQSGVFAFVTPAIVAQGYGLTGTLIHEYGHWLSLSHPHDGYDPATGVDYGPTGPTFFAWLGDESNTIMSYIDLNWDFSQFDLDNTARHHAAGFATVANRIAADVLADDDADRVAPLLGWADRALVQAQDAIAAQDYERALGRARAAYRRVRTAAEVAEVEVEVREPGPWTVPAPAVAAPTRARAMAGSIDLERRFVRKRFTR